MRRYFGLRCVVILAGFFQACGGSALVQDDESGAQTAPLSAPGVEVLGAGFWTAPLGGPGCASYPPACMKALNFWVDLKVPNRCFNKQVGIVWHDALYNVPAAGSPWPTAQAKYEGSLGGGFEQWGVDLTVATVNGRQPDQLVVELAAFATQCGTTSWDNNGGANRIYRTP